MLARSGSVECPAADTESTVNGRVSSTSRQARTPPTMVRERRVFMCSSLYSKLRTSPLDTGLEQGYTCSIQLLNAPGKVSLFHPARPIEKARTSLVLSLSRPEHKSCALYAPQSKGPHPPEASMQRAALLM